MHQFEVVVRNDVSYRDSYGTTTGVRDLPFLLVGPPNAQKFR